MSLAMCTGFSTEYVLRRAWKRNEFRKLYNKFRVRVFREETLRCRLLFRSNKFAIVIEADIDVSRVSFELFNPGVAIRARIEVD